MTFLTLISKKKGANAIKDFRLVSLISPLYKILAKVLSNWIQEIIQEAIDGNQLAFVKDRNIMDYILIVDETIVEYHRTKKRGTLINLDLETTYDYMDWEFLDYVMACKWFGSEWRSWIHGYLSFSHFSILVNGMPPRGFSSASQGLRQEDPLSPFLFTLVADALSQIQQKERSKTLLKDFGLEKSKPQFCTYNMLTIL